MRVQYKIGNYYLKNGDIYNGYHWILKAGIKGHKGARSQIYKLDAPGIKDSKYVLHALRWINERDLKVVTPSLNKNYAELGDFNHMNSWGLSYFDGIGKEKNKAMGCGWFKANLLLGQRKGFNKTLNEYLIISAELEMTSEEIIQSKVLAKEIVEKIKNSSF